MALLATVISRIFDPFIMLAVLFVILFYHTSMVVPAFFLMVILPLLLFILAWKTKFISNWDVSDRRERPKVLWTLLVIEVIASLMLKTSLAVPVLIAIFGFALITQFWKISGHAMTAALATGFIIVRFGWAWWPVLFVVPLVGWARVVTRNHTVLQVIIGALYSWGIIQLAQLVK